MNFRTSIFSVLTALSVVALVLPFSTLAAPPQNQIITVTTHAQTSATYRSTFPVAATSTSGLPIHYSLSGGCSISEAHLEYSIVTMMSGTDPCVVHYVQAGNGFYNPATEITETIIALKKDLTITAVGINKAYDGNTNAQVTLSSDKVSGDDVVLHHVSAQFTSAENGAHVPIIVAGLSVTGTSVVNYNLLNTTAHTSAHITPFPQTITITTAAPDSGIYRSTFPVAATSTSGLPIHYSLSGGCSISEAHLDYSVVTMMSGATDCVVHFNQSGNGAYLPAPEMTETITAQKRNLTVTATGVSKVYDATTNAQVTLTTDKVGGDDVVVNYTDAQFASSDVGTGIAITATGLSVTGSAAGNYALVNTTANTSANITIASGDVTLDSEQNLNPTYDSSPKPLTFSTDPAGLDLNVTYNGSPTAPTNAGTYTVLAAIDDTNYAGTNTQTLTIAKAEQTIDFAEISEKHFDTSFEVSATSTSGSTVMFTISGQCTIDGNTVHTNAPAEEVTETCTVTAHQSGTDNYNAAPDVSHSFNLIAEEEETVPPPTTGGGGGGGGGGTYYYAQEIPVVSATTTATSTATPVGEVLGAEICAPLITSVMFANGNNDPLQVKALQTFLNTQGATLPVTGFFGALTLNAVKNFQLTYWQEVLAPWVPFGLATDHTATGRVAKTTAWKINTLNCVASGFQASDIPFPAIP